MRTDFDATCRAFQPPEGIIYVDRQFAGPIASGSEGQTSRGRCLTNWGQMLIGERGAPCRRDPEPGHGRTAL